MGAPRPRVGVPRRATRLAPAGPLLARGKHTRIRLRRGDLDVGFLTTVTVFSAPQQVTLDELRIESYFPLDEQTQSTCERLAAA